MATLIPHQFTMGSVFSQSMDILGKNFWKFSGAVLVAWVAFLVLIIPLTMLWFGIDALFQNLGTGADTATLDSVVPTISVGALAIIAIVTVLSFPMASIAYGTVQQLRGQPFSFSQSMGWALRCLVPTGVATCLWSIAFTAFYGGLIAAGIALWDDAATSNSLVFVGALTVCAILGGMFLYARFLILIPAIVAEGLGPIAGLQRSYRLTAGYTVRIWFLTFLLWLIFSAIGVVAQFIPLIGSIAVNVVYSALSGILAAVVYVELRRTKESFGIEEYAAVFD
jgi:hypothetical protein